jgi:hypothetical protein
MDLVAVTLIAVLAWTCIVVVVLAMGAASSKADAESDRALAGNRVGADGMPAMFAIHAALSAARSRGRFSRP